MTRYSRATDCRNVGTRHTFDVDWGAGIRRSRTGKELQQERCTKCGKTRLVYTATSRPYTP